MSIRFEVFTAVILGIQVFWNVTRGQWAISSQHFEEFNVCKSVHHHMIQINQPTRCNSFTSLLLDVYVSLNMFWVLPCPSSGAYNCISSLWFCRWSVVVAALLVMVWQTTTNNAATAMLQRQNQRLLMQLYAPDDGRGSARNMLSHT